MNLIEQAVARALGVPTDDAPKRPVDFGTLHKIVICQRGFVYAGDVERQGDYIVITHAVNLRVWGTSKGLGELAANGATSSTKADAVGDIRVHQLAVVALMDCRERINATT